MTWGNKGEFRYPFLNVPDYFILSHFQKRTRARAHPIPTNQNMSN